MVDDPGMVMGFMLFANRAALGSLTFYPQKPFLQFKSGC
jgi:hypothetical protein